MSPDLKYDVYFNSKKLAVMEWFDNLIKGKINNEILFIVFYPEIKKKYDSNEFKDINEFKDFKESLNSSHKLHNYEILDSRDYDSINELENKKTNIILKGYPVMDIKIIDNCNQDIIICSYLNIRIFYNHKKDDIFLERNIKKNIIESKEILENKKSGIGYFIKKRDPLNIIKSFNYQFIYTSIFSIFYGSKDDRKNTLIYFFTDFFVQSNKAACGIQWNKEIEKDIFLLIDEKILTASLANIIYKTSKLDFFNSSTNIGKYYYEKLGIKARTTNINKSKRKVNIRKAKAYHLKESQIFN